MLFDSNISVFPHPSIITSKHLYLTFTEHLSEYSSNQRTINDAYNRNYAVSLNIRLTQIFFFIIEKKN